MGDSLVASTYGRALYEAAQDAGREEQILQELDALTELLESEKTLRELLVSPAVPADEKQEFTDKVLRGRISDEMVNFLFVLIDKERVWYLGRIARYYRRLYDQDRGITSGKIFSAVPLSEAQVSSSAEAVSGLLGKHVILENEVDP